MYADLKLLSIVRTTLLFCNGVLDAEASPEASLDIAIQPHKVA